MYSENKNRSQGGLVKTGFIVSLDDKKLIQNYSNKHNNVGFHEFKKNVIVFPIIISVM